MQCILSVANKVLFSIPYASQYNSQCIKTLGKDSVIMFTLFRLNITVFLSLCTCTTQAKLSLTQYLCSNCLSVGLLTNPIIRPFSPNFITTKINWNHMPKLYNTTSDYKVAFQLMISYIGSQSNDVCCYNLAASSLLN